MLKDLLLWTAAAAGLFAVARFAAPKPMSIALVAFLAVTGICLALVTVAAIAASLGTSRAWLRLATVAAVALGCGAIDELVFRPHFRPSAHLPWWWIPSLQLAVSVFVAGSLTVFRMRGYRMVRQPRPSSSEPG